MSDKISTPSETPNPAGANLAPDTSTGPAVSSLSNTKLKKLLRKPVIAGGVGACFVFGSFAATILTAMPSSVTSGGCTSNNMVAPCIGGPTTGATGWGAPKFDDEFNGTSLNPTYWASSWFNGSSMNNVSTSARNVTVSGGNLILTLGSSTAGALVSTNPSDKAAAGFSFSYGYAEARILFPGSGADIYNWPAWWTNGQSWPANGEIDIAEGLGSLTSNYHSDSGANNSSAIAGTWAGTFHTYGLDREPGKNSIYWDGKLVHSYSTDDTGTPHYLVFNVGSGGAGDITGVGSQVKVDYVRVWQK